MSFKSGDKVRIVSCSDNPRAAGKTGRIVDEVPPGPLTGGKWTLGRIGVLTGSVLCATGQLQKL
ncbi:hypothetical protein ACIREE_21975 [Streptomyces sp. NPDC102467]|uniref:hypothetical protein n=1 Tax=Streptomyces sp. NPDC102467 TaxID=3366179 RepID=UPI00381D7C4D